MPEADGLSGGCSICAAKVRKKIGLYNSLFVCISILCRISAIGSSILSRKDSRSPVRKLFYIAFRKFAVA